MLRNQSIALALVVAAILAIVSMAVLRSTNISPGISVRQPTPLRAPDMHETALRTASDANTSARPIPAAPSGATNRGESQDATPVIESSGHEDIVVQVAGAVKHPGVYHLQVIARNDDVIKAAGGLSADANAASVNLAAHAIDGAQLYVRTLKEQPTGGAADDSATPAALPPGTGAKSSAMAKMHTPITSVKNRFGSKSAKLTDPSQGKVNINSADADELQKIRGIGPAMAARIIAYREENHGFQSLDDLMQVSGVGAKTFAKLSPFLKIH